MTRLTLRTATCVRLRLAAAIVVCCGVFACAGTAGVAADTRGIAVGTSYESAQDATRAARAGGERDARDACVRRERTEMDRISFDAADCVRRDEGLWQCRVAWSAWCVPSELTPP